MKRQSTREELTDHWTLERGELALRANKAGSTRLGFAVLLKTFGYEGRFPSWGADIICGNLPLTGFVTFIRATSQRPSIVQSMGICEVLVDVKVRLVVVQPVDDVRGVSVVGADDLGVIRQAEVGGVAIDRQAAPRTKVGRVTVGVGGVHRNSDAHAVGR